MPPSRFPEFPFLFGGTFIEAFKLVHGAPLRCIHFPSFSEGLSLRRLCAAARPVAITEFPFLFGGTFIEAALFWPLSGGYRYFPSFSEGLSLRLTG